MWFFIVMFFFISIVNDLAKVRLILLFVVVRILFWVWKQCLKMWGRFLGVMFLLVLVMVVYSCSICLFCCVVVCLFIVSWILFDVVNFRVLFIRLLMIFLNFGVLSSIVGIFGNCQLSIKFMFFCVVVGLKCFNVFCSSGFSFIKFFCRVVFLVLRWLSLRSFLICRCRSLLFFFIIFRCCCIVGRLRFLFFSICFRGLRMSVSGVWSLWLMLVKNCDFIWFSF